MSNLSSVNAIRFLGIDAINKANSGPPRWLRSGPMAYSLYKITLHQSAQTKPQMLISPNPRDHCIFRQQVMVQCFLCPSSPFWF